MKKYIIAGAVLVSGLLNAQQAEPKLEAFGPLVKATYYHDNGKIQQEGFFKDGKLEGQWVSYDRNGSKIAVAEYDNGAKTGKWMFIGDKMLSEVNYDHNKIASVKSWKQEALANRN